MIKKGIAVIGSTTVDKIVGRNLSFVKMGGVTTYSGITYQRHDIKTLIVTNIAKQDKEITARLRTEKIAVFNGKTAHTTQFVNYINGEERQQRLPLKAQPITYRQIVRVLKHVNFLHLGPLHPSDINIDAFKFLKDPNLLVILDVQGYVRSVKKEVVYPAVSKNLSDALKVSQIVKANEAEYNSILDFYRMDLAELMTMFKTKEFIVTLGKRGGFVKEKTGDKIHYDADSLQTHSDPTGAGDVFLASYIIGRFLKKKNIQDACAYAAMLSAQQIEGNYIQQNHLLL